MKLGLIADTHMPGAIRNLWPQVFEAFHDVDAILHAGDLHTLEIVDRLGEIAPTWVAAGNGDVGIIDERLQDIWALDFQGFDVGMIHQFPSPARRSSEHLKSYAQRYFGEQLPEILIYCHTH
ncbi:MAG: metallophosphoesterase family protein, partial [Pseudomonadales bacterium]